MSARFAFFACLIAFTAAVLVIAARTALGTTPPTPTVKQLRVQNNQLRQKIHMLIDYIHQLQSDITDCVSKIPPPVGP